MPNSPALAAPPRQTTEDALRLSLQVSAVSAALHEATGAPRETCERWAALVLRAMRADDLRLLAYCGLHRIADANGEDFTRLDFERRIGRAQAFELGIRTATLAAANLLPEDMAAMRALMQADNERERFRERRKHLTNRSLTPRGRRELLDLDGNTVA